ncbi:hypothetical protein C7I87_02585 [Mesorhizobium sp. SARCC-RB16n]|nr:hypothetical protein C7I87_02585 [Mesorhizobium sp. SARCC-RB16n]
MAIGSCAGELARHSGTAPRDSSCDVPVEFSLIPLDRRKLVVHGTSLVPRSWKATEERAMNSVIYLIGLVVVVLAVLSFLGFH